MPDNSFSDEEIIDQLLCLAGLGGYGASQLIISALYVLATKPEYQEEILEEIEGIIPKESQVTLEQINKLDFVHCFLKETLRKFTPKSLFPRVAARNARI
jgi:cytochrome P450